MLQKFVITSKEIKTRSYFNYIIKHKMKREMERKQNL